MKIADDLQYACAKAIMERGLIPEEKHDELLQAIRAYELVRWPSEEDR